MIVGGYYINNFLVLGLVLAVGGGTGYVADVPGMLDGGSSQSSMDYNISLLSASTEAGSSQVLRVVKNDGSTVSGVEVSVNGETIGETGETGELTFEVPDSERMTVLASKSDVEVTRTFNVEDSQPDKDESSDGSDSGDSGDQDQDGQQDGDGSSQDNSTEQENETSGDNETFQTTFIEKVRPENTQLQSSSFEVALDLGANNSRYEVSLGGEQKLSGQINGNKTVSSTIEIPENGTVGLYVEIVKNGEVKASENYSLTFNSNTTEDNAADNGSEAENNVTAELVSVGAVAVGEQFTLDSSGSTGDIINYTWELGDGTIDKTQSSTLTHTYSSEGTYDVIVTASGENGTEDNASTTLEVLGLQEPIINLRKPLDNYRTDQVSVNYEFQVNNSASDSEYNILIDDSSKSSGTLNAGNNTVKKTVEVPETVFNTSIQVDQNGEIYKSEKRTVNASSASGQNPEYSLNAPTEGHTVETLDSQTKIQFEYEITDRKWATSANLTVYKDGTKVEQRPVSVASGTYAEEVSGLDPGSYSYEIALTDADNTDSKSKSFNIQQVSPQYNVSLISPDDGAEIGGENPDSFQNVDFNISYETDTDAKIKFEIIALESGSNTYVSEDGSGGSQQVTSEYNEGETVNTQSIEVLEGMDHHIVFENTFDVAIRYEWRSWVVVNGKEEKTTDYRTLNITEEPS